MQNGDLLYLKRPICFFEWSFLIFYSSFGFYGRKLLWIIFGVYIKKYMLLCYQLKNRLDNLNKVSIFESIGL
jgi:hypothetical protein